MGFYNVSKAELARRLGVEDSWVGKRVNGQTEIGMSDAFRIAAALEVNVVDLLPQSQRREKVTASFPAGHVPAVGEVRGRVGITDMSDMRRALLTAR